MTQGPATTRLLPWLPFRLPRLLRWLLGVVLTLFALWAALAIGYAPLPLAAVRWCIAAVFGAFAWWAVWRSHGYWPFVATCLVVLASMAAWTLIRPSNERHWRPEVAVMPRITVTGDRIHISGYRNFEYRSVDEFTPRYEERELQLSKLKSLDFYVSYWQPGPVAHTFVSFGFEDADPVVVSIETRPEVGEGFDPLASLFKKFELIYVVGDERDIVGVRTRHRDEQVFLYRTNLSADAARRLFRVYAQRSNELAERPEFYHLLSNSCTVNIVRYANRIGRVGRFDIRHLLNGYSDRYLYDTGVIDTSMPFAELRERSNITAAANAADGSPDFPARIRAGLPAPVQTVPGR